MPPAEPPYPPSEPPSAVPSWTYYIYLASVGVVLLIGLVVLGIICAWRHWLLMREESRMIDIAVLKETGKA